MGLAGEVGLAPCTVFISQGHTERSAARVGQKAGYISRTAGPSNGRKKKTHGKAQRATFTSCAPNGTADASDYEFSGGRC